MLVLLPHLHLHEVDEDIEPENRRWLQDREGMDFRLGTVLPFWPLIKFRQKVRVS
jgi:hypothetical protein